MKAPLAWHGVNTFEATQKLKVELPEDETVTDEE